MRIRVSAPLGADTSVLDAQSYLDIKEGTRVYEVLKILKVNTISRMVLPVSVNNQIVSKNYVLHDGDTLSIYRYVAGG